MLIKSLHKYWPYALAFLSVTYLTGCASKPSEDALWTELDQQVLLEGLEGLNDYYVEDINLKELSLNGIRAVIASDPDLSATFTDNKLTLYSSDEDIHDVYFNQIDLKYPASWAKAGYDIIREAQKTSVLLQDKSPDHQLTIYMTAMIQKLDRFTRYASPQEALSIQQNRDGFGGVGITLEKRTSTIHIATIEENSPAASSRLQVGDRLIAVDGVTLDSLGIEEVYTLIRGPINRHVRLEVLHEDMGPEAFSINLIRSKISPNTVFYDANLLYPVIRISNFNNRTAVRMAEAIARAKDYSGDQLKGIILDLRGNPGGLLQEAIDAADLLLDHGIMSQTRGRNPLSFQKFEAEPGNVLGDIPLIVLIDGATASAAEILAAGLQDQKRAVIVGAISYGKGTVQNVVPLSNYGELQLTWARYLAPNNYHLQGYGVLPNICTVAQENGIAAVLKTLRAHPDKSRLEFINLKRMQFDLDGDVKGFRHSCLWEGTTLSEADPDIEAAKTLLSNPDLYEDALAISYISPNG
ncbi:S41 family peptidase [Curvivirga sp.]|uniref:S41 family peptidase n=1 Tax=Curvivirga sp. TaxID=2856848 RepID=UPI003B5C3D7E